MRWMIAARPVSTTSGRPVSVAPAGGRGSAPSGSGWPWLSSEGTPGRAAPDCSGAAPWAGGAWIAGALAGGGSGGQSTQPAAGRVRHADGASRHAVRCAHSLRYASQRSSRRTGQRSAAVGLSWPSPALDGAGLPPPRAGLPGTFLSPRGGAKRSNGRCALPHHPPPGAGDRHRLRPCHNKGGIGWGSWGPSPHTPARLPSLAGKRPSGTRKWSRQAGPRQAREAVRSPVAG